MRRRLFGLFGASLIVSGIVGATSAQTVSTPGQSPIIDAIKKARSRRCCDCLAMVGPRPSLADISAPQPISARKSPTRSAVAVMCRWGGT